MPKFALEFHAEEALTGYFWSMDQVPRGAPTAPPAERSSSDLAAAGGRLVSSDGFGCVSCHQIGSVVPDKAPLNARGPALAQIDRRFRREWFDRFMPNPARIVPRMEMPSVQIPVKGVLRDNIGAQLAAVWHVLSKPGFEPPEPNPVRVLRQSGIAERKEPPIVINDVVTIANPPKSFHPYRTFIHPLVIGLPNRQNFLYDLNNGRLAVWWMGDVARQRTKGKSWHWELGGPLVVPDFGTPTELAILRQGRKFVPSRQGQHVAELLGYATGDQDVSIYYRLRLVNPANGAEPFIVLRVTERWTPDVAPQPAATANAVFSWAIEDGDQSNSRRVRWNWQSHSRWPRRAAQCSSRRCGGAIVLLALRKTGLCVTTAQ
jgi:hypothetical protein